MLLLSCGLALCKCFGSEHLLSSKMEFQSKWEERERFGPSSLGQIHQVFSGSAGGSQRIDVETRIFLRSQT